MDNRDLFGDDSMIEAWELIQATPKECELDNSGLYVVINRVPPDSAYGRYEGDKITERPKQRCHVRVDLMSEHDEPIMSWQGLADDIRKHLIEFIFCQYGAMQISTQHAAYIGYELMRAEMTEGFVQD